MGTAEIQENLDRERKQMIKAVEEGALHYDTELEKKDSHQLALDKEKEMEKFERALGINKNSHTIGQAFDQELQANLKLERMEHGAQQEQARLEAAKKAEKAQQKAEKLRAKAEKAKKKAEEKLAKLKKKQEKRRIKKEKKEKKEPKVKGEDSGDDGKGKAKKKTNVKGEIDGDDDSKKKPKKEGGDKKVKKEKKDDDSDSSDSSSSDSSDSDSSDSSDS